MFGHLASNKEKGCGTSYLSPDVTIESYLITFLYTKSFKHNTLIVTLHMSLVTFNCPYCTAENQMRVNEVTTTNSFSIKAVGHSKATSFQVPIIETQCVFCRREYSSIKFPDYAIIKRIFQPKIEMLESFNIRFPTEKNLDNLLNNISATTRPKQALPEIMFGKYPHLHIHFTLNGERAYVDCEQITNRTKTILRGLSIGEV